MNIPQQADTIDALPFFFPPLWKQRRSFVCQLLLQNQISSVLDLGCGEGSLLQVLLNECRFQKIAGVDVDKDILSFAVNNCLPREMDYRYLRELPVSIDLFHGSLIDFDDRCVDYEAITCIEV